MCWHRWLAAVLAWAGWRDCSHLSAVPSEHHDGCIHGGGAWHGTDAERIALGLLAFDERALRVPRGGACALFYQSHEGAHFTNVSF